MASPAPVLFLCFNRPRLFERVLEAVRAAGPRHVLVAVDGPRPGRTDDETGCAGVRRLAEKIDWATALDFKFEPKNLGCGPAVSGAISWALGLVPELIILEDDCLPDPSFLFLCDELLERYRDDTRVMQIGASSWGAARERFTDYSYAFTSFAPIWGWATWRRAWALYDFRLDSWPRFEASGLADGMALSPRARRALEREWNMVRKGGGTWDFQWFYTVLRHHGLSVCPERNLVVNIGFESDGTQIQEADQLLSRLPLEQIDFPLRHPPEVARSARVESVFERVLWMKFSALARAYRMLRRAPGVGPVVRTLRKLVPRPQ